MAVSAFIDSAAVDLFSLQLSEEVNTGWRYSFSCPAEQAETINANSSISLTVHGLTLTLIPDTVDTDGHTATISGRDAATAKLCRKYFNAKTFHCMTVAELAGQLCDGCGLSLTSEDVGSSYFVHYAGTASDTAFRILTNVLEMYALSYWTDGSTIMLCQQNLDRTEVTELSNVLSVGTNKQLEGKAEGIILNKTCPTDIRTEKILTRETRLQNGNSFNEEELYYNTLAPDTYLKGNDQSQAYSLDFLTQDRSNFVADVEDKSGTPNYIDGFKDSGCFTTYGHAQSDVIVTDVDEGSEHKRVYKAVLILGAKNWLTSTPRIVRTYTYRNGNESSEVVTIDVDNSTLHKLDALNIVLQDYTSYFYPYAQKNIAEQYTETVENIEFNEDRCKYVNGRRDVLLQCLGKYEENWIRWRVTYGPAYINPNFDPYWPSENQRSKTPLLWEVSKKNTTEAAIGGSRVQFNAAARVGSFAVYKSVNRGGIMRVFNNTDDLDLTAYLPSQSGDSAIVRIIGVSNTACPTGYSPSFSLEIGNTENAPSLSSTIWPTTDIINAPCDGKVWGNLWSFYLWHTNRGTDEIKAEVPIDVSFRAGQQISYKGRRAQIKQVTHVLQAKTVTSSLTCDGVS